MARIDRISAPTQVTIPSKPIEIVLDGQLAKVDPHDLVLSGAEKEELTHNRAKCADQSTIEKLVKLVYDNAAAFIFDTLLNIMPKAVIQSTDNASQAAWLDKQGFESVQDGLTTVVRMKVDGNMRVVRTMKARIEAQYESDVETWIRRQNAAVVTNAKS